MRTRILSFCLACTLFYAALSAATLPAAALDVSAQAALLWECSRGDVVWEKNGDVRLPMASTTKIMTALVALECGDFDRLYPMPPEVCGVEGSSVYLRAGEYLSLEELLYAVLLQSANDAAAAVAVLVGGDIPTFAEMMNDKAAQLGLSDTHFTNPHGLDDENHYTTARDLARIAAYALENDTFRQIVSTRKTTIPQGRVPKNPPSGGVDEKVPVENHGVALENGDTPSPNDTVSEDTNRFTTEGTRVLVNHNRLLRLYPDIIGVKTGFTKRSGRCLVSAAEQNGVRLVAVTLNAPDDWQDHRALLDEGFTKYESVTLAQPGSFTVDIPCASGNLTVTNREALTVVLPKDTTVTHVVESTGLRFAPVSTEESVAFVRFYAHEEEIGCLPLFALEEISLPEKHGIFGN